MLFLRIASLAFLLIAQLLTITLPIAPVPAGDPSAPIAKGDLVGPLAQPWRSAGETVCASYAWMPPLTKGATRQGLAPGIQPQIAT